CLEKQPTFILSTYRISKILEMEIFMMYNHLNLEQRNIIAYMRNIENCTIQYIENSIGVHKSTVSREIKRNSIVQRDASWNYDTFYITQAAVDLYLTRRAKKAMEKLTPEYISTIKDFLKRTIVQNKFLVMKESLIKTFLLLGLFITIYMKIKIPKKYWLNLIHEDILPIGNLLLLNQLGMVDTCFL
ncbi:MAG: helix-turn-helix domain-containing protein, partial [Mycoplasmatales bacterium]